MYYLTGEFEFVSVGGGQVAIRGTASNRWLGMDRKGKIAGMVRKLYNHFSYDVYLRTFITLILSVRKFIFA